MKWITHQCTLTNTNLLSAKRRVNSRKIYKELSGTRRTNTNLYAQVPRRNSEELHHYQSKDSIHLSKTGEKSGANLKEHMRLLAYEEFCYGEFECGEYNRYACQYKNMLLRELKNNKKEIEYIRRYGPQWATLPNKKPEFNHDDKLTEIQVRLYECEKRCIEFETMENEFLKKISFH